MVASVPGTVRATVPVGAAEHSAVVRCTAMLCDALRCSAMTDTVGVIQGPVTSVTLHVYEYRLLRKVLHTDCWVLDVEIPKKRLGGGCVQRACSSSKQPFVGETLPLMEGVQVGNGDSCPCPLETDLASLGWDMLQQPCDL